MRSNSSSSSRQLGQSRATRRVLAPKPLSCCASLLPTVSLLSIHWLELASGTRCIELFLYPLVVSQRHNTNSGTMLLSKAIVRPGNARGGDI